jgi:hypothetical protein
VDFEYRTRGRGKHAVATSWKVAGSIPVGVMGNFLGHISSGSIMALGLT